MTTLKAFRLPTELADRLKELAEETQRSEKFYVVEALRRYFEDIEDASIAKERFENPTTKIVSSKEMKKRLGI